MSQKIAITSLKLETCVNRPRKNYTAYNEEHGMLVASVYESISTPMGLRYGSRVVIFRQTQYMFFFIFLPHENYTFYNERNRKV